MWDKIKNLLNVKAWIENFVGSEIVKKAVKHGVSAVVGLLGSAVFIGKVQPILTTLGVTIDPVQLAIGLTTILSGLAGSFMNWAIAVMNKEKEPASAGI